MANNEEQEKLFMLQQVIEDAQTNLAQAKQLLHELGIRDVLKDIHSEKAKDVGQLGIHEDEKIIEGVFDGQHMVGPDGKQYTVPANYASKSKLVEGDILKLTIAGDGSFIYKQIGPVERKRMLGVLVKDEENNEFRVLAEGKSFRVLLASVTYFKGDAGDEAVILVPEDADSKWAAVENVVKNFSAKSEEKNKETIKKSKKMLKDGSEGELADGSEGELTSHPTESEEGVVAPEHQGTPLEDLDL